jgi:hypothetical protein
VNKNENEDSDYDSNDNDYKEEVENNSNRIGSRKFKRRREQLHDIIYVESYKEYNAMNQNWY